VSHPTWGSSRPPISFPPPTIPTFMRCRAS
jgi:hypothetical protein